MTVVQMDGTRPVTISDLLRKSLSEHTRAWGLRQKKDPQWVEVLTSARDLRLQALAEDPERKDPAWAQETVKHSKPANAHKAYSPTYPARHDDLIAFYAEKLG